MKIFITRSLHPATPFRQMLATAGCQVEGHSLLRFAPVAFDAVPCTDWVFFYSKQGARFFYEGLSAAALAWPEARIAALGPGTSQYLARLGAEPLFTGSGKPEEVAQAFLPLAEGRTVLFPRAETSIQSIQKILGNRIRPIDMVVYTNAIDPGSEVPDADLYVFTSPLNADAFFSKKQAPLQELDQKKVVAIGDSTGKKLTELGFSGFHMPVSPAETDLAACVLSIKDMLP